MVGIGNGLAQFKQDRMNTGLEFDPNSPQAQQAQQFGEFQQAAQPLLQQATMGADTRANNTFNQIKQAGLAGLANQFRRSQRDIAFDTARRGTLGGSRSLERNQGAQAQAEAGIGGVLNQASQQAEAQRAQELSPVRGFQQQMAQGDPLAGLSSQRELQGLQQQGAAEQGQFDITSQLNNVRNASAMNRAQNLQGAISNVGMGIGSVIDINSRNNQLEEFKKLFG